jgi:glyoxylase-like metal-dependent hydrolase (beta-lactamase superfamily II)
MNDAAQPIAAVPAGVASPAVHAIFDPRTGSVQYVVADPGTGDCAIIDPVLDFDLKSGTVSTRNADLILDHVARSGLRVAWILDTHPHADHFSAAAYLKKRPARRRRSARRSPASGRCGRRSTTCRTSRPMGRAGTGCSAMATRSASGRWRPG